MRQVHPGLSQLVGLPLRGEEAQQQGEQQQLGQDGDDRGGAGCQQLPAAEACSMASCNSHSGQTTNILRLSILNCCRDIPTPEVFFKS